MANPDAPSNADVAALIAAVLSDPSAFTDAAVHLARWADDRSAEAERLESRARSLRDEVAAVGEQLARRVAAPDSCDQAIHDVIREDDRLWARQPPANGGVMVVEDPAPGEPAWLEMRNCRRCGASLSRAHHAPLREAA